MTRIELLKIVVGQARGNGFEFRKWYTGKLGLPWITADAAFIALAAQRRYYALLFAHEFASNFWKSGTEITFQIERQTFQRVMPDGSVATISRKPFVKRSARRDVWRYHLRQMALAEEPLRYIRKYLRVEEDLDPEAENAEPVSLPKAPVRRSNLTRMTAKPLSKETPAFLRRPYP